MPCLHQRIFSLLKSVNRMWWFQMLYICRVMTWCNSLRQFLHLSKRNNVFILYLVYHLAQPPSKVNTSILSKSTSQKRPKVFLGIVVYHRLYYFHWKNKRGTFPRNSKTPRIFQRWSIFCSLLLQRKKMECIVSLPRLS